jgi:sporulation protein YlmC with PRC-barrel domain
VEITYGARVEDRNGKLLGTVSNIMRDAWTGEISKFSVRTETAEAILFYSPKDVSDISDNNVKLKIAYGEVNTSIQFGARVFDKNGELVGTVDYPVRDSLTGEIRKFKVRSGTPGKDLLFSMEDVERSSPEEVRLKIDPDKIQ